MAIMMPEADQAVLARRDEIVAALRAIVPGEGVIDSAAEMLPYESDGLMAYRQPPMVVVLPETTAQVSQVLKYCHEQGINRCDIFLFHLYGVFLTYLGFIFLFLILYSSLFPQC